VSFVDQQPDYLIIGHVTRDLLPGGASSPGGTALYAGLAAARLGLRSAVVTAAASLPAALDACMVACAPAGATTTLAHRYRDGLREQEIRALAPRLGLADVPLAWRAAPIVHLGPVLGECDLALLEAFPNALVGASGQGWLRGWRGPLPAPMERAPWAPEPRLLARLGLLTLSIEDVAGDLSIAEGYAAHCPLLALTRGAAGLTLFIGGAPTELPAYPASERDANGAGDVFTAAMLAELHASGDPLAAARFGAAAAACAVEGFAFSALPSRAQVRERMIADNR
jgi:sugar/nucleoside kinase (ribokinase family)